jgi:Fe-S-cluster containining protein
MKISKSNSSNVNQTILKHLFYLFSFSKKPVEVLINNKRYVFGDYDEFIISPSFFRSIGCQRCGNCCGNHPLIFDTPKEGCKIYDVKIDGKDRKIYYLPTYNQGKHCQWYDEKNKECKYHKIRPILSQLPHIFIQENIHSKIGKRIFLVKRQFSRNFHLKCKSKVKPFNWDEMMKVDIPCLERLNNTNKLYNNPTYYEDIILFLKKIRENHGIMLDYFSRNSGMWLSLIVHSNRKNKSQVKISIRDFEREYIKLEKEELKC